jgi:hypothetical protein
LKPQTPSRPPPPQIVDKRIDHLTLPKTERDKEVLQGYAQVGGLARRCAPLCVSILSLLISTPTRGLRVRVVTKVQTPVLKPRVVSKH